MENTINERFRIVVEDYIKGVLKVNKGNLASFLGLKPSLFSEILNNRTNLSLETASKFLLMYPMVDTMWLLTGAGEMLKASAKTDKCINTDYKELAEARKEIITYKDKEIEQLKKEIEVFKKAQKPTIYSQMVAESTEKLTKTSEK